MVGMNATRAASIRLRAAFDGAVSLGRVQTPTLALVVKREQAIRDFKPEPYWLVEARFAADQARRYAGRYLGGKRIAEEEAGKIVREVDGQPGEITKLEKKEEREKPQLLYDLTTLQRHANTLYGFSARRTLSAAQRLYEEHKALTYPRTNSRYLSGDLVSEIKPTAELVGHNQQYKKASEYVTALESLPLGRVVNDEKVTDHHAIIPTRSEHDLSKMGADELKVYDLVARRFLAVFHPEAVFERTRVETTVATHIFRTSGRVLLVPGWKAVYGEEAENGQAAEDDTGGDQMLPKLEQGEGVQTESVESLRKETQPPRRFTDASLLGAMETAGKDIDDAELREAMKDSGIGTPATRAAIIERLIAVGYIEREGRALVATEKGMQVIKLLGEHALTSPELTGTWEHRLGLIEQGSDSRERFMSDIAKFAKDTVEELDKLKGVKIERANLGPCPVCGRDVIENRKGYSCWSRDDPGCGFVVWKQKAGKNLPASVVQRADGEPAAVDRGGRRSAGRPHEQARDRLPRPLGPQLQGQARPPAERGGQVARGVRRGLGARRGAASGRGGRGRRRRSGQGSARRRGGRGQRQLGRRRGGAGSTAGRVRVAASAAVRAAAAGAAGRDRHRRPSPRCPAPRGPRCRRARCR